jgi:hypothetical protein
VVVLLSAVNGSGVVWLWLTRITCLVCEEAREGVRALLLGQNRWQIAMMGNPDLDAPARV